MRDGVTGPRHVWVGQSSAAEAARAVDEAAAGFNLRETCFVLAFVPKGLCLDEVGGALQARLGGLPVFGCTSAGQITPDGYSSDALLLLAFPKAYFRCASVLIEQLRPFSFSAIAAAAERQEVQFQHTAGWNRLALLFTDGLSKQEDLLVSTLETVLPDIPVFGGSAGDGLDFDETFVLQGGRFYKDAALLLIIETSLGFKGFSFDHFQPTDEQLIITGADPEDRLVFEINGAPAAQEYARLVGCARDALSPRIFAENPILVHHKGRYFVRAISDATEDDALSFMAAIDDGVIMTLGRGKEMIETLRTGLDLESTKRERPDFILGFDCVLRRLEVEQRQLSREVSEIFREARVLGFNTYGEQHCGVHMNQTFVGVAFFGPDGPGVL
ncbi:FIST N domain protein [Roseovarius tolerans]|uniref:FIST N domain protein n=1 Tax=Roseovarius tolerans TaxID=74031 RepID=A0A0L6CWL6_9RHOB|nr:FIST N-terminal domain-containing protein [Roseovarius tolerans]KNX42157.1 FIST N domain protein [Roseovarius tolerans]